MILTKLKLFHPISNLPCIKKLVEQLLRDQMTKCCKDNKVILPEHHGGMKKHSMVAAKAALTQATAEAVESKETTVLMSTDLSSVYDLIDHHELR